MITPRVDAMTFSMVMYASGKVEGIVHLWHCGLMEKRVQNIGVLVGRGLYKDTEIMRTTMLFTQ